MYMYQVRRRGSHRKKAVIVISHFDSQEHILGNGGNVYENVNINLTRLFDEENPAK